MTFSDQSGLRRRSSLNPGARLRNVLIRTVGPEAVARLWWQLRGRGTDHFRGDLKKRFSFMYDTGFWVGGDTSLSGMGRLSQIVSGAAPGVAGEVGGRVKLRQCLAGGTECIADVRRAFGEQATTRGKMARGRLRLRSLWP